MSQAAELMPRTRKYAAHRSEAGFATITALFLMVIAVMLVTAYSALIQSTVGAVASENYEMMAVGAAMSGVQYAAGQLINDTPSATAYADVGLVITEALVKANSVGSETVLISQVMFGTSASAAEEYVELFNPTSAPVNLKGMRLTRYAGGTIRSFNTDVFIAARSYYLYGSAGYTSSKFVGNPVADTIGAAGPITTADAVKLIWVSTGDVIDAVGWDATTPGEGTAKTAGVPAVSKSIKRKPDDATGSRQDNGDNATDFNDWSGIDTAPRNSATAQKAVYVNPSPSADRRYEFIEIQNTDSVTINIAGGAPAADCWISVGSGSSAGQRYIHPLFGGADTLAPYDIGVIVALDADTAAIANLSGKAKSEIHWFGLGPAAGPAVDTMLGPNRALCNTGDSIVLGRASPPGAPGKAIYGVTFPDSIPTTITDSSWMKRIVTVLDDTAGPPYDAFVASNWETGVASPGVAFSPSGGSVDGAIDTSWYWLNGETFVKVSPTVYYRVRIFDEAGKINLNTVPSAGSLEASVVSYYLDLADQPNPPFSLDGTNMNLSVAQGISFLDAILDSKPNTSQAWLITPSAINLLINSANTSRYHRPFFTVYGWKETNAQKININMAESPVLRAGIIAACTSALGKAPQEAHLTSIADKIHNYITNPTSPSTFDTNQKNDGYYASIEEVVTKTIGLTAAEKDSITQKIANMNLVFKVSSSNYFTIYASGFVFGSGRNPMTDTPLARSHVIAVLRRSTTAKKGEIIYWRETFDDDFTRMPIGTGSRRYNWVPWDPVY